jgi:hypothetical protein
VGHVASVDKFVKSHKIKWAKLILLYKNMLDVMIILKLILKDYRGNLLKLAQ